MVIPNVNDGDLKFPPRTYQSLEEINPNIEFLSRTQRSGFQGPPLAPSANIAEPPVINYFSTDGLRPLQLVKPDYRSTILDDWTWEAFSIGVGAGALHVILADLNHNNKKLILCFEVFFYFTNVISFLCNMGIMLMQYIREPRKLRTAFESAEKSPFMLLVPINLAAVCIGSFRYGLASGWLEWGGAICWFHCYIVLLFSVLASHCLVWFKIPHFLDELQPNFYLLPIPILLTGVMAVHLLDTMPVENGQSLHTLVAGYLFGGFGIALAIFYLFTYFLRMILHGHGNGDQTAGSILVAGMLGFSAHVMIGLGKNSRVIFSDSRNIKLNDTLGEVWYGSGLLTGLILLGLSLAVLFMAVSNSWWKAARNPRPNLTLWMISTTCCSWAITSACSSLYETFESTWLRVIQIFFVTGGIAFYLAILPLMIIRYFKKIGRTQTVSRIFPPTRFAPHSPDHNRNAVPPESMNQHHKFTPRTRPNSHLECRSSISKNSPLRNSVISQDTLFKN
ncbi:hypothetical protein PGT21_002887 [Puccinia graminis f. sp. tritici]|uniref:Uncharacterized protein n=1 Tax=Puccinia graminis f. sp. tritici TaxID=56615 RepID=A0A5B0PWS3_PUCGR|nr:hypothetical protein PGTUg99_015759 [Puccinia graminis f. sp. tritici]KAA1105320.1 hypothetical protein PGT21_002887 [Puccinia graminis f. sp. tritici]